jgi:two-component system, cell cycle sensor histidine kinase and response regulator CckA
MAIEGVSFSGRAQRVLLVEDDDGYAALEMLWLEEEGRGRFVVTRADRLSAAHDVLASNHIDAVLLDLSLPDSGGLETFRAIHAAAPDTAIVLMTATGDERLALQALQEGAQDYLTKADADRHLVVRSLQYAIERRRVQATVQQLLEAQRLDSLSVLAGGVAHQLNNLLVVILGHAELALDELPPDHPVRHHFTQIEGAAGSAARLARQMLAYSGRGGFVTERVDVGDVVRSACAAVGRHVHAGIRIDVDAAPEPLCVLGDQSQLAQLVVNLLNNAVEALQERDGGIRVETRPVDLDAETLATAHHGASLLAGRYAEIAVSDTGPGMTPGVQARIFEPFFTTHLLGRGLGLPAALGIARGHHGAIHVRSVRGEGTTVRAWFPAAE